MILVEYQEDLFILLCGEQPQHLQVHEYSFSH